MKIKVFALLTMIVSTITFSYSQEERECLYTVVLIENFPILDKNGNLKDYIYDSTYIFKYGSTHCYMLAYDFFPDLNKPSSLKRFKYFFFEEDDSLAYLYDPSEQVEKRWIKKDSFINNQPFWKNSLAFYKVFDKKKIDTLENSAKGNQRKLVLQLSDSSLNISTELIYAKVQYKNIKYSLSPELDSNPNWKLVKIKTSIPSHYETNFKLQIAPIELLSELIEFQGDKKDILNYFNIFWNERLKLRRVKC